MRIEIYSDIQIQLINGTHRQWVNCTVMGIPAPRTLPDGRVVISVFRHDIAELHGASNAIGIPFVLPPERVRNVTMLAPRPSGLPEIISKELKFIEAHD